jgi:hypothetical protein
LVDLPIGLDGMMRLEVAMDNVGMMSVLISGVDMLGWQ